VFDQVLDELQVVRLGNEPVSRANRVNHPTPIVGLSGVVDEVLVPLRIPTYPLTAPATRPLTICLCAMEKKIMPGTAVNMAVAAMESHCTSSSPTK